MDRNKYVVQCRKVLGVVALRKESVDRNYGDDLAFSDGAVSLSARRAWIEIEKSCTEAQVLAVALRKESVDRNRASTQSWPTTPKSLSARRAWIEISGRWFSF